VAWAVSNEGVGAILECYYPAQSTGEALYRVLTSTGGDSVPAARLPVTWPQKLSDVRNVKNSLNYGDQEAYVIEISIIKLQIISPLGPTNQQLHNGGSYLQIL